MIFVAGIVVGLGSWATSIVDIDSDRWSGTRSSTDVVGRFANAQILLHESSAHIFTTIFGLGNSSSFQILGIYPHIASLEILAEEGFVGALLYIAIICLSLRSIKRLASRTDLDDSGRNVLGILAGLFIFELVLSWKQGTLLSSVYVFLYAIILARLEETSASTLSVSKQAIASPSMPRFPNLIP